MTDIVERLRDPIANYDPLRAEAAAEIERLRGQNAELELTGSRKELQLMLDQLGLDFERMRERAAKAEAEIERLRADKALIVLRDENKRLRAEIELVSK